MRFFIGFILLSLIQFALYYLLPWWWWGGVLAAAFLSFGLQLPSWQSFLCGLLSVGLFWGGMAYWSDAVNGSMFSAKMAEVIPANLLLITTLLGALLGSMSMLSGKLLRDIVSGLSETSNKKRRSRR